tara:strand:+ start:332 stop:547 length:216 start_codon:yes stop_codon:yes gene_type:complete
MKKGTSDWEFDAIFGDKQPGDIRKEHIIYRRRSGITTGSVNVERITITREYFSDDDYQDSTSSLIIQTSNR